MSVLGPGSRFKLEILLNTLGNWGKVLGLLQKHKLVCVHADSFYLI